MAEEGVLSSYSVYCLVTCIFLYIIHKFQSPSFRYKLPPGPYAWPIIGNFSLFRKTKAIRYLSNELRQKYGDVIQLHLGHTPTVLVNSYDLAVEALVTKFPEEMAGRPQTYIVNLFTEGGNNIAMADYGQRWKMHREIAHSALRQFAQGKQLHNLSERAFEKFKRYIDSNPLAQTEGINPYDPLYFLAYSIMSSATFGGDYDIGDPEFNWFRSRIEESIRSFLKAPYLDYIPGMKYLPLPPVRRYHSVVNDLVTFLNEKITQHRETLPETMDGLRDITDFILMKEKTFAQEGDKRLHHLQDVHIRQTMLDMFGLTSYSSSFTLYWIVGLLSTHPEVQQKCYDEIQANLTLPLESFEKVKRENLPYVDATLHEVMRYGLLLPLGAQHKALEDIKIGDFDVPKGTVILINQFCFAFDAKYWESPHTFEPQRFLDENGNLEAKKPGFMPFGCGRRRCPGETVAKTDLFDLTVALVSEYTMVWSEKNAVSHVEEKDGNAFVRELKPFCVKFMKRTY